jgi:heat shock protein HtpX
LITERQATPWCGVCSWNLDCYEPSRRRMELRWKWADKMSFEAAYDLNERQFATMRGTAVDKPPLSLANFVVLVFSMFALVCEIALATAGLWLLVSVGSVWAKIGGAVALLVAIALRPRLGKLDKYADPIDPETLPTLNRLITNVATAIGAPRPSVLLFDNGFNASSGAYGLRRRRYVMIGLPLWLSLTPAEQVALISHELGHFVNGDVRRGPLARYGFQVLGQLAYMMRPDASLSRSRRGRGLFGIAALVEVLLRPIFALISLVFSLAQLAIEWLSMRASHHAEYAADAMSSRVAGGAAMIGCLDTLLLGEACGTVVSRAARNGPSPAAWREAAAVARRDLAPRIRPLRQLSMRDSASLAGSHPPVGLRSQLVESRPPIYATVGLTESESAEIDRELANQYRSFRTAGGF